MEIVILVLGTITLVLCVVAVLVYILIAKIGIHKAKHFDRVLERAAKLVNSGKSERALDLLSSETKRLAGKENRSTALDIRLARLRLAYGKLLEAAGRRNDSLQQLRSAITTPSAETEVVNQATVLLLRAHSLTQQDVTFFLSYLSRAPNPIMSTDPFVQSLDESHYRLMFQDRVIRDDAIALADLLRTKGVSVTWMLRIQAQEWADIGEKKQATAVLKVFVGKAPDATREDRRLLAQLLVEQGKLKAGFEIYRALAEEAGAPAADIRAAGNTALQLYESAKLKLNTVLTTAERLLARAVEADKNDALTWTLLGRVRVLQRKIDDARTAYERSLECGADDAHTHLVLADILLEQSLPAQALPHLRRAAEITASSGELWGRCGTLALELGDEETALHAFENAVARPPALPAVVLSLAQIRHRRGDHARVVELLDERSDLPADTQRLLGRSLAHVGKAEQAIRRLTAYAKAHRSDQSIRLALGMLHGRLGQWANAAEHFASITDPSLRATALPYHAYVCLRDGARADAAHLAALARRTGEASALLHHVTAALARADADVAQARAEWDAALQLEPGFAPALHGLARLCEDEKDYEAAATWYARLREAEPHRSSTTVRRGVCLTRAGRYDAAVAAFTTLGADVETNVEAQECLAYCHAKQQHWEAAAAALEKLPKTGRRAAAKQRNEFVIRYEFARGLYRDGAYEQARRQLELLPANQLGQSSVTRAIFVAQTALVRRLLPPQDEQALQDALQRLRRIAPASFAAQILPSVVELARSGRPPQWASIANVPPANAAQQTALAILAAAAGETTAAQALLSDQSNPISRLLHGVAAANAQRWDAAFVALRDALQANDATSRSHDELIRLTAACGIAAGKAADVRTTLEPLAVNRQAMRILGVLAAAKGHTDEAAMLSSEPNLAGAGVADARLLLLWRRFVATMQSGDHAAAAAALENTPPEIRSHPALARAQLDLRLRSIESAIGNSARHAKTRQSLRMLAPELLTPPRELRRAAIAAARIAAQNVGVRADVIADHRLAAALWATALAGPYVWESLDHDRARQKRATLPTDVREKLTATARERLLTSLRANTARGWTRDEVDLGCAWIDYEFTCAALFEKSGVGYGLSMWPKGLAAAPMLLMEDTLDAEQRKERAALRAARTTITATLAQQAREGGPADKSTDVRRLAAYLPKKVGFADFLVDADRPGLALQQLTDAPHNSATVRELRGRALVAQALKLSASPINAADALQMFEQAAALKTNLVPHRSAIIDAAVTASRNVLNTHTSNPAAALQPLEVAARLAGKATPLDQGRAAVFVQQALKLKESKDLDGAVRRLREALALANETPTRSLLADALHEQAIDALTNRRLDRALDLQRESLRLSDRVESSEVDYQARCDLQMFLINIGRDIAGDDDADLEDANVAVQIGLDALKILDDGDSRKFLGAAYHEAGRHHAIAKRWDAAISSLEQSVQYSTFDGHRKFLARLLLIRGAEAYDAGRRAAGVRDINRAHDLDPDEPDIRSIWLRI